MVRPAVTPFALACAVAAFLAAAACSDSSNTTSTGGEYPTLLTIDPLLFRGSIPCGAPGLGTYVATVTDISVDAASPVASSYPTPCQSPVSFGSCLPSNQCTRSVVAIYHYYTAAIDGYDRDDITPAEPGQRQMVDAATGDVVLPRWTTTCGELPGLLDDPDAAVDEDTGADVANGATPYMRLRAPTLAIGNINVVMHGCLPFGASPTPDASAPDASEPDASAPYAANTLGPADETVSPIGTPGDSLDQATRGAPPRRDGEGSNR